YGASAIGMLASPHSTLEELALAADLVRGLGSDNIDSRLRQTDFSADGQRAGIPWLGMDICDIAGLDAVLVVGSQLRKDHPLFAQRLRQAAKQGTKVFTINAFADQSLISLTGEWVVVPSSWEQTLAELLVALSELKKVPMPVGWSHVQPSIDTRTKAQILIEQANTAIFLGNACVQHPAFSRLAVLAEAIADLLGGKLGYLTEAANTVGAHVAGAVPRLQGLNAAQMLSGSNNPLKAMLLLNTEPDFDSADGQQARTALQNIPFVVALSVFRSTVSAYANIILPITPFTETSGTFINCEGRAQSFQACTKANGDSRPAWKVLRVLGNLLNLPGFDADSSEEVKQRVLPGVDGELRAGRLDNHIRRAVPVAALILSEPSSHGLERIAEVPIYRADVLVRRSQPLQETRDSSIPLVRVHPETAALHGLTDGAAVNVSAQGKSGAQSTIRFDAGVAKGAVRFAAGHEISLNAGALYEHLEVSAVMQEARQV
ncbi:MAG: molybdopterin-dependent oxidoreductase, partial [Burkholderiaceae bacterium]